MSTDVPVSSIKNKEIQISAKGLPMSSGEQPNLNVAIIPVTPLQQNCTLVWNGTTGAAVVIDPGGDVDHIVGAVEENKILSRRSF